jgi:hypothetical protein
MMLPAELQPKNDEWRYDYAGWTRAQTLPGLHAVGNLNSSMLRNIIQKIRRDTGPVLRYNSSNNRLLSRRWVFFFKKKKRRDHFNFQAK